jgi:tRNA 2-thiocytidine biosynthesis protein TtcA
MIKVIEFKSKNPDFIKLRKKLHQNVGKAIADYSMIKDGDKIMVCLSGGADSYTMLDVLIHMKRVAPINFDIIAVNLDQKQPGFPEDVLPNYLDVLGVEYKIIEKDTYSIVKEKIPEGATTCGLCSRLRRGILYNTAEKLGANKIALGHHADDIVETLFLNMFYGGRMKSMPPKLISDDKRNIVIRPLAYCREGDIKKYSEALKFPIIPCNLCGSQDNLQRQAIKQMLREWDTQYPGRVDNIFRSIRNVTPSHLGDTGLYGFNQLEMQVQNKNTDLSINYVEIT